MYAVILSLAFVGFGDDRNLEAAMSIYTAYNANRESLARQGTIRYRFSDGSLSTSDLSDLSRDRRRKWNRLSTVEGTYAFDGSNRIVINDYSLKDLVGSRTKIDDQNWSTTIFSFKSLSDGTSTFVLSTNADSKGENLVSFPSLSAGTGEFYRLLNFIPLDLGDPQPKPSNLGGSLARCLGFVNDQKFILKNLERNVIYDGMGVVKIEIEYLHEHPSSLYRYVFWIDLDRGAIPLRSRSECSTGQYSAISEEFLDDLRKIDGVGWFPNRRLMMTGGTDSDGNRSKLTFKELNVIEADFNRRPDRSIFQIELPESSRIKVIDNDRFIMYPARKVWDLAAISAIKSSRGGGVRFKPSAPTGPIPEMPGEMNAEWSWRAVLMILIGIVLVITGATILWRKLNHARS